MTRKALAREVKSELRYGGLKNQPFNEPRGGDCKDKGPEVELKLSVFRSLRKSYRTGLT